ncbi:PREDICTED: UPF0489 protein C5orf22 homolog isoform X2 [Priapulus caudatus]|uniref:UPF0489 protein C5orf22 homolog isoform X2 n=1 Tax=Priapulus caudatus TaxID=37621 RepID=A0ABM1DPT6_PRICU|nr:PREDICTED: UPF0489 protein C5orf22 homolog isoform X2 [Priapulus caudatus]
METTDNNTLNLNRFDSKASKGSKEKHGLEAFVVENHNEALYHIYRAIGKRLLPMKGNTIIHLDSHPDLMIPNDLPADDVYHKDKVYDTVGIADWIMPAVYAGHISTIVWLKPPWATQFPNGTSKFYIGKHITNHCIRVSHPDIYYISDLLYAPEHELTNKKLVTFHVITLDPWMTDTSVNEPDLVKKPLSGVCHIEATPADVADTDPTAVLVSPIRNASEKERIAVKHEEPARKRPRFDTVGCEGRPECIQTVLHKGLGIVETTAVSENSVSDDGQNYLVTSDIMPARRESNLFQDTRAQACSNTSLESISQRLRDIIRESEAVILDIDLDFFSTTNPFKDLFSSDQYSAIKELYRFEYSCKSEKAISACMQYRKEQLLTLKTALNSAVQGKPVLPNVLQKMAALVNSVKQTCKDDLSTDFDFDLIHEAGLTCDDTDDLPHHVSTQDEVTDLMKDVRILLEDLPRPSIITIARSSWDDYCPKVQVEPIQESVLRLLATLYGDTLRTTMDYESEVPTTLS